MGFPAVELLPVLPLVEAYEPRGTKKSRDSFGRTHICDFQLKGIPMVLHLPGMEIDFIRIPPPTHKLGALVL